MKTLWAMEAGGNVLCFPVMFFFTEFVEIVHVLKCLWFVYIAKLCRMKENTNLQV